MNFRIVLLRHLVIDRLFVLIYFQKYNEVQSICFIKSRSKLPRDHTET